MRSFLLSCFTFTLIFGTLIFAASVRDARADYFVWQSAETGLSFSFPDTWQKVNNADPDDLYTVKAPSGRAEAACRVRARDDGRYVIYPSRYDAMIQRREYSNNFWQSYLAEYTDGEIDRSYDGAGLGRGWAGYAVVSYQGAVPGPEMDRQALIFATLYHDTAFILECSSHRDAFEQWMPIFLSIAGSVDFKKMHHEITTGNYFRNFMADPPLILKEVNGMERVEY